MFASILLLLFLGTQAQLRVQFLEVGSDVVATASGYLMTSDLGSNYGSVTAVIQSHVRAEQPDFQIGPGDVPFLN